MFNKYKTPYYKNLLKSVRKEYKLSISKNVKKFKNQRVEKLKSIKTTNPKEFWKIINSVDKTCSKLPPLDELHNFFKNLNSSDSDQPIPPPENQNDIYR